MQRLPSTRGLLRKTHGAVDHPIAEELDALLRDNCRQHLSRSGAYSFSRGLLRRTALLFAPSGAASSPPPNGRGHYVDTRTKESDVAANSVASTSACHRSTAPPPIAHPKMITEPLDMFESKLVS